MSKYIILLRGINVGGNNLLPMKAPCQLLETQGYENIKSYIQSGNIVFNSARKPDDGLPLLVQKRFGFAPNVLILGETEFSKAVKSNPFSKYEGKIVHLYFCERAPKADVAKLASFAEATERYELVGNVFYLHAPDGIGRSKLAARVEACLGVSATARNLNTVNKLDDMLQDI